MKKKKGKKQKTNKNEYKKLRKLSNFNYYTKSFGFINTNLGKGLVFELIKDTDDCISITLDSFVKKYSITISLINEIIDLEKYLCLKQIMITDVYSKNILVQMNGLNIIKLIICDGLMGKTFIDIRKFMFTKQLKKTYIKREFRKLNRELNKIIKENQ